MSTAKTARKLSVVSGIMDHMARPASADMVGRRLELNELESALAGARGGGCTTMVVGGEAGIGKTRMVTEFAERATASGARTLFGQCVELGNDGVPYAPVAGVLRAMTKEFGTDQVYELAGTGRVALSGLLGDPDPGAGTPDGQPVPGPPDDDGRGRL